MRPILQLQETGIRLGNHAVGPFTLVVSTGERVAILGPSGAGKSTLLKLMSREWAASSGQRVFKDKPLAQWGLSELSHHRAVLPQSAHVAFGLQADLVVGLGRVARHHDPRLTEIVVAAAQLARAEHLLGRRFDTLSGGEQARVQLARVFAQLWDRTHGLILVDEPLAALDPGLQIDLLNSLDDYAAERHHALVAILHDINQAISWFDRLLLVKDGHLVADLPSNAQAVPALASLYGVSLRCTTDSQGHPVVSPARQASRRTQAMSGITHQADAADKCADWRANATNAWR